MATPRWVLAFYNKFGRRLQGKYDEIKAWKLPPELDAAFDTLWNVLTPDIQKALWSFVNTMYKKLGPEKAKEILKTLIEYLTGIFTTKKDDQK